MSKSVKKAVKGQSQGAVPEGVTAEQVKKLRSLSKQSNQIRYLASLGHKPGPIVRIMNATVKSADHPIYYQIVYNTLKTPVKTLSEKF